MTSLIIFLSIILAYLGNRVFVFNPFDYSATTTFIKTGLAAFFMLAVPVTIIKFGFKKNLPEFGLAWPQNKKETLLLTGVVFLINLPVILFFSKQPNFQSYYGWANSNLLSGYAVIFMLLSAVYYFSEEFLFRGFLFLGIYQELALKSYIITAVIFSAFHVGKPAAEIFYAFFFTLTACYLTQKSRSVLPAAVVHFALSIILNLLIIYSAFGF